MKSYQNILCPVDFSPISQRIAYRAHDLAQHYQASLTLIHVIEDYPMGVEPFGEPAALIIPPELQEQHLETAYKNLKELRQQLDFSDTVGLKVVDGAPSDAVIFYAKEHSIDLIVVGHNSHKGFLGFMMGSTASTILKHAECDVFILQNRPSDSSNSAN